MELVGTPQQFKLLHSVVVGTQNFTSDYLYVLPLHPAFMPYAPFSGRSKGARETWYPLVQFLKIFMQFSGKNYQFKY